MSSLVTFPLSRDEPANSPNIRNIYGRMRNAASHVICSFLSPSSFLPEDSEMPGVSPTRVVLREQPASESVIPLHSAPKSIPSVAIADDLADLRSPEPIPLIEERDHSDVESMFSTASYSLSKAYLANQYNQGRKRALNSLGREFWMKDENAKTCFRCLRPFTTFRRRHHCRVCGQIFCNTCTRLVPGTKFHQQTTAKIRCCANCLNSLSSQNSSSDEEDQSTMYDDSPIRERTPRTISIPPSQMGDEYHFSPRSTPRQSSQSAPVSSGVANNSDVEERPHVFTRSRSNTRSSIRSTAPVPVLPPPRHSVASHTVTKAIFPTNKESITLNDATMKHLELFLERVLKDSEVDLDTWQQILLEQLLHLADIVRADSIGKERAEPKEWVKLKRIPGGTPSDIETINGTVFTHNLALRDMPQVVENPRILLISFPLEYSRGESKYMSLTPVLAQETEFLKKLVGRIEALKPTVLLSSSHISGLALTLLHDAGIVVATGIREFALQRLSRYVQTEPLTSMDRLSISPALGTCDRLEVRTYREDDRAKSFMFFTGTPNMGATLLLRGANDDTKLVKAITEIMLDVSFSLKLETHLMRDEFVRIPDYDLKDSSKILSSSPFVNFGQPHLKLLASSLEDKVVDISNRYNELFELEDPGASEVNSVVSGEEEADEEATKAENVKSEAYLATLAKLRSQYSDQLPGGDETLVNIEKAIGGCDKEAALSAWTDAKQQWEQMEATNPYMFNPGSHQNIVYSFFMYSEKTKMPCVGPETCNIDFYLDSDISLGLFIETCCNTFKDPCPDGCPDVVGDHYKSYYHGNGMVKITTAEQKCGISGLQDTILMWNKCNVCENTTALTPMSASTWRYSFGKYLELSFWGLPLRVRAGTCEHDIYRDYTRYFGWHDIAVSIEYSPIELYDVYVPDLQFKPSATSLVRIKIDTYKEIKGRIVGFWNSIVDRLQKVQVEGLEEEKFNEALQKLEDIKNSAEEDCKESLSYLDDVFKKLGPTEYLDLNAALRFVQSLVAKYHTEFNTFDGLFFPSEKDIRRVTAQQLKGLLLDDDKKVMSSSDTERNNMSDSNQTLEKVTEKDGAHGGESAAQKSQTEPDSNQPGAKADAPAEAAPASSTDLTQPTQSTSMGPPTHPIPIDTPTRAQSNSPMPLEDGSVPVKSQFGTRINLSISGLQKQLPSSPSKKSKVSSLAHHFEELSKEFEKERKRERQRLLDRQQASTLKQTQPVATVFKDVDEAVHDDHDGFEEYDAEAEADNEESEGEELDGAVADEHVPTVEVPSKPATQQGGEKKSLIQSLVDFWAERSSTRWGGIEYVMKPTEHIFSDSIVVIRENEPSSLIAFCLSLPDYQERMESVYTGEDPVSLEEVMLKQKSVHLKYNFVNDTTTMSCKILFSEQFDSLRKKCGCSDIFVQSLSRCNTWENSGGKSGSLFLKSSDDRFIIKSISQSEVDSLTTFAPSYFNYMSQALFHDLPTALAKIFGVYQIQIRTATSNVRMYLMLTENLFVGRNFTRFFDLKGSMRNRKAAETGKANEVLLDENMVDYIYENPVFVHQYSKRRLRASLYNDTLFLTKMNVMDYSLVIGIDEDSGAIVAGVIDYIRAFTWDKKIESWVKGRTTHGAKDPTVISPKQYKVRFRESMEHYFLLVPDCWHQFQSERI